jgi:hypothetical protein
LDEVVLLINNNGENRIIGAGKYKVGTDIYSYPLLITKQVMVILIRQLPID